MVEQPGPDIEGFVILGELGRGTTGAVYEARDAALNRRVALMVPALPPDAERPAKLQRFLRACQALAYLTSQPGGPIPALHMVGEYNGQCFGAREFVEGSTLEQRVVSGSIDLRAGLGIIAAVARVVHWLHGRGLAHRNLSPANVLVATDGTPKLIGFGRVGLLAGSAHLPAGVPGVSPEVDIRAFQGMLGWLCTGLTQPVPPALAAVRQPGSVASADALAEAIGGYLLATPD